MYPSERLPRICLLSTGGTISMVKDHSGRLVPSHDESNLLQAVPSLRQIAVVTHTSLGEIDSANIQPQFWEKLAKAVYDRYNDYDGFVIAHGTDTLAYSASALSFFLQELGKPVVFTGAQIPLSDVGSDGASNLVNAFRVATSSISEVCVVFGSSVIRGTKARKTSAFHLEAFHSINAPPIGRIGLKPDLNQHYSKRAERLPILNCALETDVALVMVYPGMSPEHLEMIGQKNRGIVLLGYGVGNIPHGTESLIPVIEKLIANDLVVVVGTQCTVGRTELGIYGISQKAADAGAIPARDMTPETCLVKLMWVLGQTKDRRTAESMMLKSFVGEISPPQN